MSPCLRKPLLAALLLASSAWPVGGASPGGGHAEPAKPDAHAAPAGAHGDEPKDAPPPPKTWKQGEPLDGKFDLKTLRGLARVAPYRHEFNDMSETIGLKRPRRLSLSVTIEFGGEAGMAELAKNDKLFREDLLRVARRFSPEELLRPAGKAALKEEIAHAFNRRLTTAMVRQVYLTDFYLVRSY